MSIKPLTSEDFTDTSIVDADEAGNLVEVVDATPANFAVVTAKLNEIVESLTPVQNSETVPVSLT